jgi:hypothetical protein
MGLVSTPAAQAAPAAYKSTAAKANLHFRNDPNLNLSLLLLSYRSAASLNLPARHHENDPEWSRKRERDEDQRLPAEPAIR